MDSGVFLMKGCGERNRADYTLARAQKVPDRGGGGTHDHEEGSPQAALAVRLPATAPIPGALEQLLCLGALVLTALWSCGLFQQPRALSLSSISG